MPIWDDISLLSILDKVNLDGYDFKNLVERLMIYIRDILSDQINDKRDVNKLDIQLVNCLNNLLIELKDSYEINVWVNDAAVINVCNKKTNETAFNLSLPT